MLGVWGTSQECGEAKPGCPQRAPRGRAPTRQADGTGTSQEKPPGCFNALERDKNLLAQHSGSTILLSPQRLFFCLVPATKKNRSWPEVKERHHITGHVQHCVLDSNSSKNTFNHILDLVFQNIDPISTKKNYLNLSFVFRNHIRVF